MPDLADLHISQVQRQDHQGLEVAKKLWMKSWGNLQVRSMRLFAMTCLLALISITSRGNQNRKIEGTSGLCGKELNLILE